MKIRTNFLKIIRVAVLFSLLISGLNQVIPAQAAGGVAQPVTDHSARPWNVSNFQESGPILPEGKDPAGVLSQPAPEASCVPAHVLTCGGSHTWNTAWEGSTDQIDGYGCSSWDESGREYAYTFIPGVSGSINIELSNMSADLDVYVLDGNGGTCENGDCIAYGNDSAVFEAEAGKTYQLVVDGFNGAEGDYTIQATCPASPIPFAPSDLTMTVTSQTVIDLTWHDNSANEDGFKLDRTSDPSGEWQQIAVLAPNTSEYSDIHLTCSEMYYYRIRAFNGSGDSDYSNYTHNATLDCLPQAPQNLSASGIHQAQIMLTWDDMAENERGYKIERRPEEGGSWAQIAAVNANNTAYLDAHLACDQTFQYRVRAYNTGGDSAYTNEANAETSECVSTAPGGLSVVPFLQSALALTWQDLSTDELGFMVERSPDGINAWTQIAVTDANVTSYINSDLACGSLFVYRVRSYNEGGISSYSNSSSNRVSACFPQPPSDLQVTERAGDSIRLAWADNSTNESGFRIERSLDGVQAWLPLVSVPANTTSYTNQNLSCGVSPAYRVVAFNGSGDSAPTLTVETSTLDCLPAAPSGLSVSGTPGSSTQMSLTWTDNSDDETGFKIERSPDGVNSWTEISTTGPESTAYTDQGLTCNTVYYYRARAYNSGGYSTYSNKSSNGTRPCSALAPEQLSAQSISPTQITLTWTDTSSNETGFKIERSPDGVNSWTQIIATGANVETYTDGSLTCNTDYSYRVRAYTASGDSAYTNLAFAITPACMSARPTGVSVTTLSDTALQISWQDNNVDEYSYQIERSLNGTDWAFLTGTGPDTTSYIDSSLSCEQMAYYRLRTLNEGGYSSYTSEAHNGTGTCTPAAPNNLTAEALNQTQIALAWTDNSNNETGFKIERSADGISDWTQITGTAANSVTYLNTNLTCGTRYYYRIRANRETKDSAYTSIVSAQTPVCVPAAPGGLSVTVVSSTWLNLSWTDNSNNEEGFQIERYNNSVWEPFVRVGAGAVQYPASGLACGTTYTFRVRAYNSGGESTASNTSGNATLACIPAAPGGLAAQTLNQTQIALSWTDNSNNESGFKIDRSADGLTGWTQIIATGANTVTYTNTGLTCGTSYFYRVHAYNGGGDSDYGGVIHSTTLTCLPSAPSGLSAASLSQTSIQLTWNDNSNNETGFRLERSPNGYSNWSLVGELPAGTTTYTQSGLGCGTVYYYRVQAFNDGGTSSWSSSHNGTLACGVVAPTNLHAARISQTQINVSWTDNSADETGFAVEKALSGSGLWSEIAQVGAGVVSYASTGLNCGTAYDFRVRALSGTAVSAYTSTVTQSTSSCTVATPVNLNAIGISPAQIRLTWQDVSTNETGFKVERSTDGINGWTQIGISPANTSQYVDGSLPCNTIYYYRIRATNGSANSAYTTVVHTRTLLCVPAVPASLTAQAQGQTRIVLTWSDASDNESGFEVETSATGTSDWHWLGSMPSGSTSFGVDGLVCGQLAYYRVRAVNEGGASGYTTSVSARTTYCSLQTPENPGGKALSQTSIYLNWTDTSDWETGFQVERSLNGTSGWVVAAATDAGVTELTNNGLTCNTVYYYRVLTTYAGGTSSPSAVTQISTMPCTPSVPLNLSAAAVSQTQVNVTWQDASTNETYFRLERKIGSGAWVDIQHLASNATSYSDQALLCGNSYSYRIQAVNQGGSSSVTAVSSAVTFACTLLAPSHLKAELEEALSANLYWTDHSGNETSFRLERSVGTEGFALLSTLAANQTSYTDTSLTCGTSYRYRVRAENENGVTSYTTESAISALPCLPASPVTPAAQGISQGEIMVTWGDASNNEDGFAVYRAPYGSSSDVLLAMTFAGATSFEDNNLTCGTSYRYRIAAFNAGGTSDKTIFVEATTQACTVNTPSNLGAEVLSQTQVGLTWTDQSGNEAGFFVLISSDGGETWENIGAAAVNQTIYMVEGLDCSNSYNFRVQAYQSEVVSGYSNVVETDTLGCTPEIPAEIETTVGQTFIQITWQAGSIEDSFILERAPAGTAFWSEISRPLAGETEYQDAGLDCDTSYSYRMQAVRNGVVSGYSQAVLANTQWCDLYAPQNLTQSPTANHHIQLVWEDISLRETGFRVERSENGVDWIEISLQPANTIYFSDTAIACDQMYHYRVTTLDDHGRALQSDTLQTNEITCLPQAPEDIQANGLSTSEILVSWQDSNNGEAGYIIERSANGVDGWNDIGYVRPGSTNFIAAGLQSGMIYYFRVRAFRMIQFSDYSEVVSASSQYEPLVAPANLHAFWYIGNQIILTWADNSQNEHGFVVECSLDGISNWEEVGQTAENVTRFQHAGRVAGQIYYYRVRAYNQVDYSDYSNTASVTGISVYPLFLPLIIRAGH